MTTTKTVAATTRNQIAADAIQDGAKEAVTSAVNSAMDKASSAMSQFKQSAANALGFGNN